jgi:RNA polymerase sigma-70 factor (ECF subfamily)
VTPDPVLEKRHPLLRHRNGDPGAFAELVADYRKPVYSYLVRCGVAAGDRDDLFQAVFLKIHRFAEQYRPELPAHPWIFTIVANEVRSHMRRRRIRELVFAPAAKHDPPDPSPDSERALHARETVALLEKEIRDLSLPQREVVALVLLEGRPLQEAADALRLPLNTVKTHLRRARLRLADRLAERNVVGPREEES